MALLTTAEVAERCDVMPHRVRDWARRGLLPVASRTGDGRPLYDLDTADEVEAATRRSSRLAHLRLPVAHSRGRSAMPGTG